ncbi:hypothetical protein QR680_011687 [Steinernema hermaphroditum]|uniref:MADF domain-containing protein n=1 Tax=Steinernema hermaphroditum TaxID=289476 RepID=A0AA39I156_9BILA|nr:hypothetical protein QR680_011687 [Steinernema hermaphroditum]
MAGRSGRTKLEVVNATAAVPTSAATTTYRIIKLEPPQPQDSQQRQHQQLGNHSYETTTAHGNTNPASSAASNAPSASSAPSNTERGSWANNDDFTRRLIEAVRKQPSLYNPNHEHYGNKHTNSQIRNQIWAQLCEELGFPDGAQQLQTVWKRIRDRYVRERRRRRQAEQSGNANAPANSTADGASVTGQNAACRHFDSMRWIDAYIFDSNSTSKQSGAPGSSTASSQIQPASSETMYYTLQNSEPSTGDVSYRSNHQDFLNVSTTSTGNSTLNFSHNGSVLDTSGSPCSSTTSSEISVGSTSFTATASSTKGQQQQSANTTVVCTSSEQNYEQQKIETKDGTTITVTHRGKIPPKKDVQRIDAAINVSGSGGGPNVVKMFVDPAQLQIAAPQKVYRLVAANPSDLSAMKSGGLTAIGTATTMQQLSSPQQQTRFTTGRKRAAQSEGQPILSHPPGTTSAVVQLNGRPSNGHLNEEMIMDEGQIVMESGTAQGDDNVKFNIVSTNVIDPNSGQTMVAISNANVQLQQAHHMNQAIQIASTSHQMSHQQQQVVTIPQNVRVVQARTVQQGMPQGAQILQAQPAQYHIITAPTTVTDESYLANHLANTLSNMTDDDKTVFKLAIQRIIMDARFGDGTSVRMLSNDMPQPQVVAVAPTVLNLNLDQQQQLGNIIAVQCPVSLAATSIGVPVTSAAAQQQPQQAMGVRR